MAVYVFCNSYSSFFVLLLKIPVAMFSDTCHVIEEIKSHYL